ncbi:hypothetical protein K1719_016999 [Acacia pycnantha]|nr:hypothetical protein K1719_016999 [Acacia pycnantha]
MKTNALLAFFFFLVSLFASARADFVRDSDGHLVSNGGTYYIMPQYCTVAAIVGASIQNPDDSCSLAVVEMLSHNIGNATLIESKVVAAHITTDYPLQISFNPLPSNPCTKHSQWLVTMDEDFKQKAVMVGDTSAFDNPVSSRFYFRAYDSRRHLYKLVFGLDPYRCGEIAVKTDGYNNKRLIVAEEQDVPLVFTLVKKSGDGAASHISMVV